MLEGRFGSLGKFIKKRYKVIIIIWIIALVVLLPFTAKSTTVTNYDVQLNGVSSHSMSNEAQALMNSQFNNSSSSSSNGTVVVLFIDSNFESSTSYSIWKSLNSSYKSSLGNIGVTGIISPYTIANSVVDQISNSTYVIYTNILNAANGTISGYNTFNESVGSINKMTQELKIIDSYFNSTYYNISYAVNSYTNLFITYKGIIENVSGLTYGIPISYFKIYTQLPSYYTIPQRDIIAEKTLLNLTGNFGNNETSLGYFNLFYNSWNSSTYYNSSISPTDRLNTSINQAFSQFNYSLSPSERAVFGPVFSSFNLYSYSNNSTRQNITLHLDYNLTSSYSSGNPQIFNLTYQNFISNGSETQLSQNLTGYFLANNDSRISDFTLQVFNETPEQFARYFVSLGAINSSFVEMQLSQSVLSTSIQTLYQSVGIPSSLFYHGLFNNSTSTFKQYFVNSTAIKLDPLAVTLAQNSTQMVSSFLNEGANNSTRAYSTSFLESHFAGYPYFSFNDAAQFVNMSVSTRGNISSVVNGNYSESGISLKPALFKTLVTSNLSGYMVILQFSESSLNGNQLDTLNSYIASVQNSSDPVKIYYTSSDEIAHGIENTAYSGLMYSLIVGIIVSIFIVGIYFRSVLLAFVPLLFFGISFSITLGIVYLIFGVIEKSSLSFIVTTLSSILILGLSTDYSVYMLNRYMKESSNDKLESTVKWAGHAVFTSGVTVIVSYIVLALFNIPIIGDGGFVNALGIAVSLGVALTLLPSFLFLFKKKIKPRKNIVNFGKIAKFSRNHKRALVAILVVIFVSTIVVYETTPTSFDLFSLIPNNAGKAGYYEMVSAFGGDYLSPTYVLLTFPNQVYLNGHFNRTDIGIINNVSSALLKDPGISQIQTVTYPFGNYVNVYSMSGSPLAINTSLNQSLTYIGKDGSTVLMNVITKSVSYTQEGTDAVSHIDTIVKQATPSGVKYLVGGSAQGLLDSSNSINLSTYKIVEILAVIIFAVLAFQLTSVFTPLRLLFNVGTSALLAVALFYLVFHYLMNLPIIVFGPLFVIVTLFGVGLDYDIFLVTRTREAVMNGKSDEDAISEAINENASVVLVLGFILSGVFGSLIFSPIGIISEIGFSVTVGVLIDTILSWLFLIPALMLVMKKYNWWPSHIKQS
ncbi:MAG: MMPL family transporter [Thermoplasmatales archaeon]